MPRRFCLEGGMLLRKTRPARCALERVGRHCKNRWGLHELGERSFETIAARLGTGRTAVNLESRWKALKKKASPRPRAPPAEVSPEAPRAEALASAPPPALSLRKNVVKNSGTTVKNSTVKNRKSSVSYTITYFLLCFARQAWLLWRFGVRQPPKSGIQDPGSSCWMADGCTKFGREGAGTFQCPRPFYIGRNLTFPSRGTFQCRGSGPGKAPRHARKAYSKSWAAAAQPGPDPWH